MAYPPGTGAEDLDDIRATEEGTLITALLSEAPKAAVKKAQGAEKDTLTDNPSWSFNTLNSKSPSRKQAYSHYQKVNAICNLKFLKAKAEGFTLNLCCGRDPTGDVKVDIDLKVLQDCRKGSLDNSDYVLGDIAFLPFRPLSVDTVICDPPFRFYSRFKWVLDLKDLARKKAILSHPCTNLKLSGFSRELYFINSKSLFLRLWWVFTREEVS